MTSDPTRLPGAVPHAGSADDEPVEPEIHDEIPDHLDLPLEVPEADALEQELDVPLDDEER